jgi:hypothetical protein
MTVVCPSCGAAGQEVGKYCENCGFFIASADMQSSAPMPAPAGTGTAPADPGAAAFSIPAPASGIISAGPSPAPMGSAQFAVVRLGVANPAEGFTITRAGEYMMGRSDMESGSQADIDLREWVQPMDLHGQMQYLVHRKQCYLGLAADGAVTIRQCPGAELDTLVKIAGGSAFIPLQTFGTVRNPRPDGSYELEPGDQVYMGDPEAVPLFQKGDPTARGSYLVIELFPRP